VRLALWTPGGRDEWLGALLPHVAREVDLVVVEAEPAGTVAADVHAYDVADDPARGFVYRALRREPGVVLLEDWNLHRLVHAETVGRGDAGGYRREARRELGERGVFVAEQVLAGRGGALTALVPLNGRVLEASLGFATASAPLLRRAAARLAGRPAVLLPSDDPGAAARALVALVHAVRADSERLRREAAADSAPEGTLLALALDELRVAAHGIDLPGVPADVRSLAAGLFPEVR
jgi:hypothetical protein